MKKNSYPKNKEHFKELIPFAKKIISILKANGVQPVIYGSFAHFYHTRDENMKVNDIDLWIREKEYPKIILALEKKNIKFKYFPEWHTLVIKNGKLKVEIDSLDFWYRDLNKKPFPNKFDEGSFYGIKIKLISLNILKKFYLVALAQANTTKNKVKRRIKDLENFLGEKLI